MSSANLFAWGGRERAFNNTFARGKKLITLNLRGTEPSGLRCSFKQKYDRAPFDESQSP